MEIFQNRPETGFRTINSVCLGRPLKKDFSICFSSS